MNKKLENIDNDIIGATKPISSSELDVPSTKKLKQEDFSLDQHSLDISSSVSSSQIESDSELDSRLVSTLSEVSSSGSSFSDGSSSSDEVGFSKEPGLNDKTESTNEYSSGDDLIPPIEASSLSSDDGSVSTNGENLEYKTKNLLTANKTQADVIKSSSKVNSVTLKDDDTTRHNNSDLTKLSPIFGGASLITFQNLADGNTSFLSNTISSKDSFLSNINISKDSFFNDSNNPIEENSEFKNISLKKDSENISIIDSVTGEENEDVLFSVRGKLFWMPADGLNSSTPSWRERGIGTLRLNSIEKEGSKKRLGMKRNFYCS